MKVHSVRSRSRRRWLAVTMLVSGLFVVGPTLWAQDEARKLPGIYGMNADGTNFKLLVKLEGKWNGSPMYSPDGKQLLFDASPEGRFNEAHVYRIPADGAAGEPTDLGLGNTPAWSPDGKRIAFYAYKNNADQTEPGVWVMNADGTQRTWLCYGGAPRWCPDGKRLVFVNNPEGAGDSLYMYDLEKNETEPLLNRTYARIHGGACSPDGKRLAFIAGGGGNFELVILPLVGDEVAGRVRLAGQIGWRPCWSADGKYVVCWIVSPQGAEQLHRVEVDTAQAPELLPHQDAGRHNSDPSWSADGKRIAFMSDR